MAVFRGQKRSVSKAGWETLVLSMAILVLDRHVSITGAHRVNGLSLCVPHLFATDLKGVKNVIICHG